MKKCKDFVIFKIRYYADEKKFQKYTQEDPLLRQRM